MGTYQRIFTEILRGKLIILHITFLLPEIGAIKGSTILRYLRIMESCAQKCFFLSKDFIVCTIISITYMLMNNTCKYMGKNKKEKNTKLNMSYRI